jgi:photosystem II stability/assembly factor-like uncharacterized protein
MRPIQTVERKVVDHAGANPNPWQLVAAVPYAVIKDISFATPKIGYMVTELGQVLKTSDGGVAWTTVLGTPYFLYGVHALDANRVVISGSDLYAWPPAGFVRWSHDGGVTWTDNILLTTNGSSIRVRFAVPLRGLVMDSFNLDAPNAAHYTTTGGFSSEAWTQITPDPGGGWFGNQFSLLRSMRARISGITYCTSSDAGKTWACRPSIDSVFDGATHFANDAAGWVGGGTISPSVEGWVHRTVDGGTNWSGRTLASPWPIREIRAISSRMVWAAGGNFSTNAGGIHFSSDGGQTWSLDLDSGAEMDACDSQPDQGITRIWCAGYNGAFTGVVYTLAFTRN